MKLSSHISRVIVAFSLLVLGSAILAIKFASHPVTWLVALIASIPLFAAIAGAFFTPKDRSED